MQARVEVGLGLRDAGYPAEVFQRLGKLLAAADVPAEEGVDGPQRVAPVPRAVDAAGLVHEVRPQPGDGDVLRHAAAPPAAHRLHKQAAHLADDALRHHVGARLPHEAQRLEARARRLRLKQLIPVKVDHVVVRVLLAAARVRASPRRVQRHAYPDVQRHPVLQALLPAVARHALRQSPHAPKVLAAVKDLRVAELPEGEGRQLGVRLGQEGGVGRQRADDVGHDDADGAVREGERAGDDHHGAGAGVVQLAPRDFRHRGGGVLGDAGPVHPNKLDAFVRAAEALPELPQLEPRHRAEARLGGRHRFGAAPAPGDHRGGIPDRINGLVVGHVQVGVGSQLRYLFVAGKVRRAAYVSPPQQAQRHRLVPIGHALVETVDGLRHLVETLVGQVGLARLAWQHGAPLGDGRHLRSTGDLAERLRYAPGVGPRAPGGNAKRNARLRTTV
mmetsp:Transcript_13649/g.34439  ORF Transcript_13649/g.34439 Transcript_13649/m.34439 type:complete len:445 (+) Transcript_13649:399-1733(+)